MMQDMATNTDPVKIAAVAAAVQAYLDSEWDSTQRDDKSLNTWRMAELLKSDDAFTGRKRSWTGRDSEKPA